MSDQKFSCQGCDRTDLTLTRNGKVRSHAADGKRANEDNPACGMGSEYPVESTGFHTHTFEYGDDNHGHSGSFCDCGMEEPTGPPAAQPLPGERDGEFTRYVEESGDVAPVPPNPFRNPLPGGVWDKDLPHDRNSEDPATAARASAPVQTLPSVKSVRVPDVTGDQGVNAITRPPVPPSADSFLDDADEDAEDAIDGGPSYWPARYDGECTTCFSHFDAGDMIRKLEDGTYEAQQCCGFGNAPRPEVPKSVARTLPVVRGRYKLPDPETGKTVSASRSSKFAEGIADSYMLDQWRHRMILVGVVQDPEILEKVRSGIRDLDPLVAVKQRWDFLNKRAEDAMSAAGGDIRSGKGTTLHKYTEEVDAGTRDLADVPEEYRPDAAAYRLALANCGFRPVKGLIERSVFCREMNVCGTFDRVLECIRTTDVLDLDGRAVTIHEGEFVIGDVKSGDNIKHPWLEILIQEALYAHAVNENGVAVQDEPGGPFRWAPLPDFGVPSVREDVGVVMHIPYGSGECKFYAADLITGWRGAKICRDNRDFWKIELPKVPIATYIVTPDYVLSEPEQPVTVGIDPSGPAGGEALSFSQGPDGTFREMIPGGLPEEPEPESPKNIMEAVHRAKHLVQDARKEIREISEDLGFIKPTAATVKMPGLAPDDEAWDWLFRTASTREQANDAWREAKGAGLPPERIKELVALVHVVDPKPQEPVSGPPEPPVTEPVAETTGSRPVPAGGQDGPPLTLRAHQVTTKAEASAVFREINDKINDMPEDKQTAAREYRDKLVVIMQERLAGRSS